MFKYVFFYHVGYVGMDSAELVEYHEQPTEEQLYNDCWQGAVQHAEHYGYYPRCYAEDDPDFDPNDPINDCYIDSIDGWWKVYNPAEHDQLL